MPLELFSELECSIMGKRKVRLDLFTGTEKGLRGIEMKLILASGSPRRRQLLKQIGLAFDVITSDAAEQTGQTEPDRIVIALSRQKAEAVQRQLAEAERGDTVVIGADTIVFCEGKVLGKPRDESDAFQMIKMLSGRKHSVYTGVTLMRGARIQSFFERTAVSVYPMTDEEIAGYIRTGEPMDKAGAYGIQGAFAAFIKGIEGDYNNVVGLPVGRVYQELKEFNDVAVHKNGGR